MAVVTVMSPLLFALLLAPLSVHGGCVVLSPSGACRLPGVEPTALWSFDKSAAATPPRLLDSLASPVDLDLADASTSSLFEWLPDAVDPLAREATGAWFKNPDTPVNASVKPPSCVAWARNPAKLQPSALASSRFSVEVWLRPTAFNQANARIISLADSAQPCGLALGANVHLALQADGTVEARVRNNVNDACSVVAPTPLALGALAHVVLVWDGATTQAMTLFVNNDAGTSLAFGGARTLANWNTATAALTIGGLMVGCNPTCTNTQDRGLHAKMYLAAVYDVALTKAQVATLSVAGPRAASTSLQPQLACPPTDVLACGSTATSSGTALLASNVACAPMTVVTVPAGPIACGATAIRRFSVVCGTYTASCDQTVTVSAATFPPTVPVATAAPGLDGATLGAIIGGVVGALLLVALVVLLVVIAVRKRRTATRDLQGFKLDEPLVGRSDHSRGSSDTPTDVLGTGPYMGSAQPLGPLNDDDEDADFSRDSSVFGNVWRRGK